MKLFGKSGGILNIIRCDETDYVIWKWHPSGTQLGTGDRENAIRWGSSLRVKDGEAAVFVYNQGGGINQEFIVGPYDGILKTSNLPLLSSLIGLAYDGKSPFQAEVYFINLARIIQVRFGVPFFDVYDPRFEDFGVPVAVRGTITFQIRNCCEFVRLHRLSNFSLEDFQRQIRDAVTRYVKDAITNAPAAHNIPLIQIETKTAQINDAIEYDLRQRLEEEFGILVSSVDIGAIELDKSSDGYRQLMSVTRDTASAAIKAESEAKIHDILEKQKVEAEHYQESLRIQREEAQYAQHKQTQTAYFGAYQAEKQAEVGIAGAEALGRLGATGVGPVNTSGGPNLDPVGIAAGMAIGGVIGKNIAGTLNRTLEGIDQPLQTGSVPPPVPQEAYYVAANGKAAGPFDMEALSKMIVSGSLHGSSLVWKQGMSSWERADCVEGLKQFLTIGMPPIPPVENDVK